MRETRERKPAPARSIRPAGQLTDHVDVNGGGAQWTWPRPGDTQAPQQPTRPHLLGKSVECACRVYLNFVFKSPIRCMYNKQPTGTGQ